MQSISTSNGPCQGQHADEAARRRIFGKIARVNRVDGVEILGVRAVHVALDDVVERGAGGHQAKLDLLKLDLALDRPSFNLAGRRIERRNIRDEDQIAASIGAPDLKSG